MTPGQLIAQGTLFLSAAPYSARTSDGRTQHILRCVERRGTGVQHLTAIWTGAEADTFIGHHAAQLKAGQPVAFTFSRIFCHNSELHGIVYTATLAPGRWDGRHTAAPAPPGTPAEAPVNPIDNPASAPAPL